MSGAPTFEIRTKSGRIAGPFSREKLKQYANDKRLDPRCDIRKYDPEVEQPWRPCWKTKGLFSAEVVEACRRAPADPNPKQPVATAEPEPADDNWAFAAENREEVVSETAPSDDLWANVPSGPMPAPAKATKASRRKEKRGMRPKRSGGVAWHSVGTWMVLASVVVYLSLTVLVGLSTNQAASGEAVPSAGVLPLLIGAVIGVPISSIFSGLLFWVGFLIVRVPSPGFGELCGTGFSIALLSLLFNIAGRVALRVSEASAGSSSVQMLFLGFLATISVASIGMLMMRHGLDPLRAIVVWILPVFVFVALIFAFFLALGVGLSAMS